MIAAFEGPVGIERHAYDIPLGTVLAQGIEVVVVEQVIVAVVQMHYDLSAGEHLFDRLIAGLKETRILLSLLGPLAVVVAPTSVSYLAHRPQHTCRGLVAHLHPSRRDTVVLEQLQHLAGVSRHILQHLFIFMLSPRSRHILLTRVCPPVRVVEVYHHLHAQGLCTQRLDQHIVLVAPAAVLLGIHPYAQTNGIEPQLLHQRCGLALLAHVVIHFLSALLHLRTPADVGTKKEIRSR